MVEQKLGAVAVQILFKEQNEDFEDQIREFITVIKNFLEKNRELKDFSDIPSHFNKFEENIDTFKYKRSKFMKTLEKKYLEDMISALKQSWRNLHDILKIVVDKKDIGKLRILDKIRGKKIDIVIDNLSIIIRKHYEYLEEFKKTNFR